MLGSITEAKPLALPMLVGLFASQVNFLGKIAGTLVMKGGSDPVIWESHLTYVLLFSVAGFYSIFIYVSCEGQRYLAARYFLPASFVSVYGLSVIQDLLFFREWQAMTAWDTAWFTAAFLTSLVGTYYISPAHKVIPGPGFSPLNSPLLAPREADGKAEIEKHQMVLEIIEEYRLRKPQPQQSKALEVRDMSVPFRGIWCWFPITVTVAVIALPMLLWQVGYVFSAFVILTVYASYNGWKMGMHIAVFAYVGCKKVAHYENADFHALYKAEMKGKPLQAPGPSWEDVVHFVVLPNYKEDMEVLRLAIMSVAKSKIAKSQIYLVLAMEARESGSKEKAETLTNEFRSMFKDCWTTFHPPGIAGEMPGKSSNTKWAAKEVFEQFIPQNNLTTANSVFTVADADSEFHSEYFAALSYHFLHAGCNEGDTPVRYLTIWQPPIMHMKNYITQPAIVRLCSFVTCTHELACLADPNATRVPYSTYSISAVLAQAVQGWDPDWISEDWHMALKCFLATAGRLHVSPIFLPVLNYSPEGDSFLETLHARWTQGKRHALGFSEMAYYQEHFTRIIGTIDDRWDKSMFLWKGFFIWFKLLMIHLVMATFWIVGPFNGLLIAWFIQHEQPQDLNINSWTFLLNCVCQSVSFLSFNSIFVMSVMMYETVKDRVDGSDAPNLSIRWRSPPLNCLLCMLQSMLCLPFFFFMAASAEWIAAVKTARTHKFHYDVALKPNLNKEKGGQGNSMVS